MQSAALYIHIPWCIRKCPYCDFNSHKSPDVLPEQAYIDHLVADFKQDVACFGQRRISSVFIGGGTPSLFSGQAYARLFSELSAINPIAPNIEITLEANPGTVEQNRFKAYRELGINRLSLGIQSFNPEKLRALGRIHDEKQAHKAIENARLAGFENINIDIMHGLPQQSLEEGLEDLQTAIAHQPEHLSWYQLTLEPNTVFFKRPPPLPDEDSAFALEKAGLALLSRHDFKRYEISAFCRDGKQAKHNLNYWQYGDYFGIGAGAHGKLLSADGKTIYRRQKKRQPTAYSHPEAVYIASEQTLDTSNIIFEYMLNATRLERPFQFTEFETATGVSRQTLRPMLEFAENKGLLMLDNKKWQVTEFGRRFTNELQAIFLQE